MKTKALVALALCVAALPALASDHRRSHQREHEPVAATTFDAAAAPQLLVRVQRVTAVDPDGRTVTLYEPAQGPFLPIDRLARIAPGLDAARMPKQGAYTRVTAELGEDAWVVDGGRFVASSVGAGIRVPLTGAVIRTSDRFTAYGLDIYRPAEPKLAHNDWGRGRDHH